MITPFERSLQATLKRELKSGILKQAPALLASSIRYSLLSPGKRIRPRLLLQTAKLLGVPGRLALPAACALEMIHCFSLIHDDLPCMDDDDMRRGQPSNHKKFDEATALLAGDALVCLAYQSMLASARTPSDHVRVNRAVLALTQATGSAGMIGGQALEFDSQYTRRLNTRKLQHLFSGKTGALFVAAFEIPCVLAGLSAKSNKSKTLIEFGQALGYAFQVADDLDDRKSKSQDPISVMQVMSAKQAVLTASQPLNRAMQQLKKTFGKKSAPILEIGQSVLKTLEA